MRRLVTPFSASNEPGLIVRRHAMLLNFDPLRAVILRDRLLVIVPDGADSILVQLEKRVRGGLMEMERSCLGATTHGASDDDMKYSEHSRSSGHPSAKNRMRKLLSKVPGSGEELPVSTNHSETPSETTEATHQLGDEYADAAAQADDEWNDLQGTEWIDLPFELQCTDAILHTVSAFLTGDTIELQEASLTYIQSILKDQTGSGDDPLTIIRAVKEAVREMSGRVKGFVQSMNRILDEDEDMALMNLSRLVTHPDRFMYPVTAEVLEEESDEPELILESYLQESLSLQNVLESIQGQIDTAAELVDQRLDSVRNRILMANMVLTAFSVSVSIASLVGSLFGMNVPVPYENDDSAFRKITFGTLSGTLGICFIILATLFYSGTIPRIGVASE
jgi:magnesium transporter